MYESNLTTTISNFHNDMCNQQRRWYVLINDVIRWALCYKIWIFHVSIIQDTSPNITQVEQIKPLYEQLEFGLFIYFGFCHLVQTAGVLHMHTVDEEAEDTVNTPVHTTSTLLE